MIRFSLQCDGSHEFESWFQSNDAFESLKKAGMLACPICGSADVKKGMMTPRVHSSGNAHAVEAQPKAKADLSKPASPAEQALAELKKYVLKNSEYVGQRFAREARAIHVGDSPKRSIYGEAKPSDARELLDEGIPVAPLPWTDTHKSN